MFKKYIREGFSEYYELVEWDETYKIEDLLVSEKDKKNGHPMPGDMVLKDEHCGNESGLMLITKDVFRGKFTPVKPQKDSSGNTVFKEYPSLFEIGEEVFFKFYDVKISALIRTVIFTNGKVRYSLVLKHPTEDNYKTTIHNVDSVYVIRDQGIVHKIFFDNYS